MKFIQALLSAALIGGTFSSQATTQTVASSVTNSSPEAAMTALFGDPVVVKAKGFEIKRSALDQVVTGARANAAAAGQQLRPDFSVQVLDQLITIQMLLQTATPADQTNGQLEADIQYTNLLKKFISPEAFERQLKAVGMTVPELRAKATQEAVAKAALKRELNINVTDEEARDYYNQHAADFEQPEMVHARHILLFSIDPATHQPLSTNTIAAKRQQIEELRKRILAGEDFATLAKEYSEDPGSKANGGELPEFSRGQMVAEFESAAFALATNQVSDVVVSPFGFHIIKLLGKTPAKKIDFATAETDIKDGLAQLKIRKLAPDYVKKLRADQQVEILDANLKAMDEQMQAAQAAEAAAAPAEAPAGTTK
jgi:parvulin-like peptidyl-prolyl isomerase